jgi:hypothetical protein
VANGVTVATGNNTSPPNATKFQPKEASGLHVPAVVIGYSDGSDAFVTSDASGLAVQGTTTLSGVSASSATVTSVGDANADTALLASNSSRIGWSITNDSSAVLYVKFGTGASASSYTARLVQYDRIGQGPLDGLYTGAINGFWASDAGGNARCTEW